MRSCRPSGLLLVISLFSVALFLYNIFRRGWVLPVLGVGLWAFVAVVAGTIVPAFIQKFRVEPSESSKERPYIERNIEATKAAMNLSNVTVKDFANDNQLNSQAIVDNQTTVRNIRLWDPSANISLKTYQTLQALKPFYKIDDVDVDRYMITTATDDTGAAVVSRAEHRRRAAVVMGGNAPRVHPWLRARAGAVERADARRSTRLPGAGHPGLRTPPASRSINPTSTSASISTAMSSSTRSATRSTTRTRTATTSRRRTAAKTASR